MHPLGPLGVQSPIGLLVLRLREGSIVCSVQRAVCTVQCLYLEHTDSDSLNILDKVASAASLQDKK